MHSEEYERLFGHEDQYWWFVGRRRLAISLLRDALPHSAERVLDLGCGTGAAMEELGELATTYGIDLSRLALSFCKKRGLDRLILSNGETLPFQSEAFDGIIALDIFEHIEDDRRALREAFRVLRPGGVLVLSVPAYRWLWGPHDVALMHHRRYTQKQTARLVKDAGFTIERISYSVFFLFPLVVIIRLMEKFRQGPARVRLPHVPDWFNLMLIRLQILELLIIKRVSLPWGSSVVAVARKPEKKPPSSVK